MKKLLLSLVMLLVFAQADVRTELNKTNAAKNKLMLELVSDYYKDPVWKEKNNEYLDINNKIVAKAKLVFPELEHESYPWTIIWQNSNKLREDPEVNELFTEHKKLSSWRDQYISERNDEYKSLCDKLEALRIELKNSHKKKKDI